MLLHNTKVYIFSWSWAEVYVVGVRGTMMRLGLTLIWCFCMTSGCLCITVLPTVYFVALGIQVRFYLGSLSWRLQYSLWPDSLYC